MEQRCGHFLRLISALPHSRPAHLSLTLCWLFRESFLTVSLLPLDLCSGCGPPPSQTSSQHRGPGDSLHTLRISARMTFRSGDLGAGRCLRVRPGKGLTVMTWTSCSRRARGQGQQDIYGSGGCVGRTSASPARPLPLLTAAKRGTGPLLFGAVPCVWGSANVSIVPAKDRKLLLCAPDSSRFGVYALAGEEKEGDDFPT